MKNNYTGNLLEMKNNKLTTRSRINFKHPILFFTGMLTVLLFTNGGQNAFAQSTTFGTPYGTVQTYTVPVGCTKISATLNGGCGGNSSLTTGTTTSGKGGTVVCTYSVTPGSVLNVYVGAEGNAGVGNTGGIGGAGACNGGNGGNNTSATPYVPGGGGGGSSAIRIGGTAVANTVLEAAGGGGGAGNTNGYRVYGGDAFFPSGIAGGNGTAPSTGGGGGGAAAGGTAGAAGTGAGAGTAGSQATGGTGGTAPTNMDGGGGGGGGWYGGGGGGGGLNASGGGAGSNYVGGAGVITVTTNDSTATCGNGSVIICAYPSAGAIAGKDTVCVGSTMTLSDATETGTSTAWSSGNTAVATVGSTGIVTGVSSGTVLITLSATNACGTTTTTTLVNVFGDAPISGTLSVCVGQTTTLTDASGAGTWSSTTTTVATIGSATGIANGVLAGTSTISFVQTIGTVGCAVKAILTVNAIPSAILGNLSVCAGLTTSLSDTPLGGTWNSGTTGVATINSGSGLVSGVSAGTSIITYTLGTGCISEAIVTVNPLPAAISGNLTACVGLPGSLSDASGGGTWGSSNGAVATINSSGAVTTLTAGTTIITYTLPTGCIITTVFTVNALPTSINGVLTVCVGSTTSLTDGTGGGTWTSNNITVATIGTSSGTVSGVATGTSIISYISGAGCSVSAIVTVNTMTPINPNPATICLGGTLTLTDATGGGVWSSTNGAVATIGTTGLVTSTGIGTTTISYVLAGCSAINIVTVNSAPGAISPATATVCTGSTTDLTDATSGGVWTSSNGNANVIGGSVSGVTAGTATISYSIGTCSSTAVVTINTTPAAISPVPVTICLGGTATLTDATSGGAWNSSNGSVATVAGGVVTSVGIGTTTISYTLAGCSATTVATVNSAPAAISPATATVCTGATTNLTDATTGGVWASSNTSNATVSGGVVTGVAAGTATISYSIGTCSTTAIVTVNQGVAAISPSSASLCIGNTVTLTDATGGGTWSSSSPNATVSGGLVTAISAGTATISYTLGSCYSTAAITIGTSPSAISPSTATVCVGSTANLTDAVSGGVWSSNNTSVATVGGTGIVTGVTNGTTTISYSIGTCFATAIVTVNPGLSAGTITGSTSSICPTTSVDLTDAVSGGTWSASNGNATVGSTGIVTGVTVGTDVISYTVSSTCGSATATTIVTISATVGSGTILGPLTICQGSYDIYVDFTSGGTWSVTNGNAVISPVGVVTALTAGSETVVYTVAGACAASTLDITIIPSTTGAGTITGPSSACVGSSITLSDATAPGGTWSGTNGHATVGSGTGLVTGVNAGLDTVIYTLTTACGTYTTSATVNVDATSTPSAISGPSSVCVGSSILLTDADAGGNWSSSNANATVTSGGGLVTGVLPGLDTVTYTVINGCGLGSTTKVITVVTTPSAGTITGPSVVCTGSTINLTDAVSGGTWSATNGNATVSSTGLVTGVTSGTDIILYTITAACGTVSASMAVTINPLPDGGSILGPDSVCIGSTITLNDFATGGTWSAGNSNATISSVSYPSAVITGVLVGTDPISYTVSNSCGTASGVKIITVVDVPNAGVITGISSVCIGSAITLIDTVPGGIWLSSNGNAELVGPGIVTGITAGIDSIFYLVTNSCGTNEARKIINVNPIPVVPAISGPSSQCVGTMVTYTDGLSGGIWGESNTAIASINSSTGGVVGLLQGIDTISYTVTNVFGCPGSATTVDTINAIPVVGAIMGNTSVCLTSTITLSDTTSGGVWSSSNTAIGSVDATGDVTGTGAGTVTISYTVAGICGTTSATQSITVNPLPVISAILGTTDECVSATATLSNTTGGGVWSSSNTSVAIVDGSGDVTGITAGTSTIIYQVTNIYGCVSAVSVTDTVNALPIVSVITGVTDECLGSVSTLNDATGSGVWSSSNTSIAAVDASGDVTGVAGGIVTISYTVTNGTGCSASATTPDTVNTIPTSSPIMGVMTMCAGSTSTLTDALAGGVWSSTNASIATVDPTSGIVTGVAAGMDTIIYTVTNSCGSVSDSAAVTVNAIPSVDPITATTTAICSGSTVSLSDATTGGVWSSSNTSIATVNSTTGAVTGVSNGTVTITYTITNGSGCSAYAVENITIATAIAAIDVVPASATLCHGNLVNMHVSTSVSGLTYQWLCNGNVIVGATNSGYITDSAGTYSVEVSNGVCTETLAGTVVSNQPHPIVSFTSPDILYTGSFYAYQWYKNGVAISGANSSTLIETGNGNYTVVVTDINGCSDTSAVYIINTGGGGSTGINNVSTSNNIRIYPNPATSTLTIDADVAINVTLLGIDGRMIMHQDNAHNLDISDLPNGMYMVMIYDENNVLLSTAKFVKSEK